MSMMELSADGRAAAAFIALSALGVCGAMIHEARRGTAAHRERVTTSLVVLLVLILAVLPALETVSPGEPLAGGEVTEKGQHIAIPPAAEGGVLLVVRGSLAKEGAREVLFSIAGMEEVVVGTLEQTHTHMRRRGVRTHAWRERLGFHQRGFIPQGSHELRVERLEGSLEGPLRVELYRSRWPFPLLACAAGLSLLTAAVLHARLRLRRYALWAGTALGMGLFTAGWGEPHADIMFAAASLFMGFTLGAPLGWLAVLSLQSLFSPTVRGKRRRS
ncbi:hypothetical protein [Myxococcus xanthus]|uniref:Uncharacterized protein n=1 Tax=Myxococcus xanthus TaxID=34 RepID=A0A7Y4IML2_MYXXA|nr:hypothetical protein [Myxococcus xanthus]NOJ82022.1 hypothetical protein [Myxococcus xanthus]NOJ89440.1 hypothetical protein [Myxococcus xanthus]